MPEYYQSSGGYYYKIIGGNTKRTSKCDYEKAKTNVRVGDKVRIKIKRFGRYEDEEEGVVKNVLTGKRFHSRGKKVRLTNNIVGRVICVY